MSDTKANFEKHLPEKIAADPDKMKAIGATFLFTITGDGGGVWTVDLKDDVGVKEGDAGGADCTIECSREDFESLLKNPATGMQLFFSGKLKVGGNAMLATKLQQIL